MRVSICGTWCAPRYPNDSVTQQAWIKAHQKRLFDKGKIEKLVLSIRSIESTNAEVLEKIRIEADYLSRNAQCRNRVFLLLVAQRASRDNKRLTFHSNLANYFCLARRPNVGHRSIPGLWLGPREA